MKKLPKTQRGVPVARGKGMNHIKLDQLIDTRAYSDDEWPAGACFVVTSDRKDETDLGDGKVFGNRSAAIAYAKARGNGNVNQRVLRCVTELLVIATENEP